MCSFNRNRLSRRSILAAGMSSIAAGSLHASASLASADEQGFAESGFGSLANLNEGRLGEATRTLKEYYAESSLVEAPISVAADLTGTARAVVAKLDSEMLEHAWLEYAGALRTNITGGGDWKQLQIVTVPQAINWDDATFGSYNFHRITADAINDVGPSYKKTNISFSERFGYFLNDVLRKPLDQAALTRANSARTKAESAQKAHSLLADRISREWQQFDTKQTSSLPPSRWLTIDDWYDKNKKNRILKASQDTVDALWGDWLAWMQKAYGGGETLVQILERFRDARKLDVFVPGEGTSRPIAKTSIYPYQLAPDYPTWLAGAKARQKPNVSFKIKHNSYQYDYRKTVIAGGLGIGLGFFGLLAGGRRTTVQIDTKAEGFELDFEADVQAFEINPGDWYDSSALALFKNGPFYPGSPMDLLHTQGALFGPKGFFNFMPKLAIVAYKPKITIKLSKSQYDYFREETIAAGGFFIGPFLVAVGGYYDLKESVKWDSKTLSLTLYNAPESPHLLAFDSQEAGI